MRLQRLQRLLRLPRFTCDCMQQNMPGAGRLQQHWSGARAALPGDSYMSAALRKERNARNEHNEHNEHNERRPGPSVKRLAGYSEKPQPPYRMPLSAYGALVAMRPQPRRVRSILRKRPAVISSAMARPAAGACIMPCPENPDAT